MLNIAQLSVLLLFTCAAVTLALPDAFNCTVAGLQSATGAAKSCTVMVAEQVEELPFTSVTVKVTVLGLVAIWAQVNAVWLNAKD